MTMMNLHKLMKRKVERHPCCVRVLEKVELFSIKNSDSRYVGQDSHAS